MDIKVKDKRGRKPLPEDERKVPVTLFIKARHREEVQKIVDKIAKKYSR